MAEDPRASYDQCVAVPCRTCGAAVGDPCVFTNDRRNGAMRGESMGRSIHARRSKVADAALPAPDRPLA